jgi:hypothetical protein
MNMQSHASGVIDGITSFLQKLSQFTEWFLAVLAFILLCYAFVKGTSERKASDRRIPGS